MTAGMYRLSRCVLLAHEDKVFQGAIVASMSIPWGETKGDRDLGGYHLVWTRDLVQSATALLATGQMGTPLRALIWLAAIQRPDGSFPQNSWIDGTAYWSGLQLDEIAFPILLAWRLHKDHALGLFDPRVMIVRAAARLILQGRSRPGTLGGKFRLLALDAGRRDRRARLRRGLGQGNRPHGSGGFHFRICRLAGGAPRRMDGHNARRVGRRYSASLHPHQSRPILTRLILTPIPTRR